MLEHKQQNRQQKQQQIPTLEIVSGEARASAITAVVPVILMAYGIMEMLQKIWGDAAPGRAVGLIGIFFGTCSCIAAELLKEKRKRTYGVTVLFAALVWLLAGIFPSIRGLQGFFRIVAERWSAARDGGTAAYTAIAGTGEIRSVTLLAAVLITDILWVLLKRKKHLFCGGAICFSGLLFPLLLNDFWPVPAAFLMAGNMGIWIGSKSHLQWKQNAVGLFAGTLLFLIPALLLPRTDLAFFTQIRGAVKEEIHEFRYGTDSLPNGNLYQADMLQESEDEMLQVRSEQQKNLYLKGYVGGTYAQGVWEPLSGDAYRGESAGMLEWLSKRGFDPLTQAAAYYALCEKDKQPDGNRIQIENTGASRYYVYAPATLKKISSGGAEEKKDLFLKGKGLFGQKNYGMTEASSSRPAELTVADSWVENPESSEQKIYCESEAVYRRFVYANYLAVDQKMYDKMQEVFWADDTSKTDGIYSALDRIRKVLENRVTYTETPGNIPENENPIFWFLDEAKEGNAMLYASTAVEALRAKGIPARYAEGYYLSENDAPDTKGVVSLTGKDAHAWVEIYFDGIGWLPADVTPGYYYNVASLQKMVGSPESIQKNVALENNSLAAEQITGLENKRTTAAEAVLPVLRSISLFLLGVLAILVILLTVFVIVLETARIICLGPVEKEHQKERPAKRLRRTEKKIYQYLHLWELEAGLGWKTKETDAEVCRKFTDVEPGEYTRICHLIEKHVYGEVILTPYEERTLNYFLEKLMVPTPKCDWKMRLKLRYACLLHEKEKRF